eukprot:TRINITY_DN4026_c0_g1_i1.p1 TRINITY_DN4026_c0_g1~~TRINITY_DN4026_c0_g1_i1.p1  ORF type:complete len:327 (-),score=47.96 TRINITY_DN4026_c0_g1_i1:850-1830(-)
MRPILLKGHERPLTYLKYNRDGDLIFTCAKDHNPNVWYGDSGERLGNYKGHNGAVWTCDVTRDSAKLITGSADQTAKLWDVETGTCLHTFEYQMPARAVAFGEGDKDLVVTTDPFMGSPSAIYIYHLEERLPKSSSDYDNKLTGPQGRTHRVIWGPLNRTIISGGEDSIIRMWDVSKGTVIKDVDTESGHQKAITSIAPSADNSHFLTGSQDKTSKLWDSRTLDHLKTYVTERPVNAVAISPLLDHVVIGGGQHASEVTTTSSRAGKFEAKFFHKIYEEEIGGVRGHFGPINALTFSPDGRSFASGGEDGYVRVHHFDSDYFNMKY